MKERPILFSTPMVKTILDGRKTQTRRVIIPQPKFVKSGVSAYAYEWKGQYVSLKKGLIELCPYGQVGDRLWVRETWAIIKENDNVPIYEMSQNSGLFFKADNPTSTKVGKWRPSIHMPRWASRITLEITEVRVERLQEITEEDCYKEGIELPHKRYDGVDRATRLLFQYLWDTLNAKRGYGWDTNPWVWVLSFNLSGEQGE